MSRAEYQKAYYEANKKKMKEQQKIWNQSQEGKKSRKISHWKDRGLIGDYNQIYERYVNTHKCDVCNFVFDESNWKCMDHDHETGLFRQILCNYCNIRDNWLNVKLGFE